MVLAVLKSSVLRTLFNRFYTTVQNHFFLGLYFVVDTNNLLVKSIEQTHGKLKLPQLVEKFLAFYVTRRFVTALKKARNYLLSRATRSIISAPLMAISLRFILILSSHLLLGLPSDLFPSSFPIGTLCAPNLSTLLLNYCKVFEIPIQCKNFMLHY